MIAGEVANILQQARHREDFVVTECKNGPTWFAQDMVRMDLVAVKKSWSKPMITAYEIKVSRQDFLSDDKWPQYLKYCDRFCFACPEGIIKKADIQAIEIKGVGLVYVYPDTGAVRTVVKPLNRQVPYDPDFLMYILLSKVASDRWPFFSNQREHWQAWHRQKLEDKALGSAVRSKLAKRLQDLAIENEKLKRDLERGDGLGEEIKQRYGVNSMRDLEKAVTVLEALAQVKGGWQQLRDALNTLKNLRREVDDLPDDFFDKVTWY